MTGQVAKKQKVSEIFKKYKSQLMGFISKRVSSKEDSEDILQNVFFQLSKADIMENPIDQISAWLYSVVRNQIIDRSRKHKEVEMPLLKTDDESAIFAEFADFFL